MTRFSEIQAVYHLPFLDLVFRAQNCHRDHHKPTDIQRCALLSIKTGGCSENCGYCAQSAWFETQVTSQPLLAVADVVERARRAKELGASRFCMGAAWRSAPDGKNFD